ncbi:MAG: DUF3224 domain-containing protein [Terracidiphilus sp.]
MPTLVSAQIPNSQTTAKNGPVSMHAEGTFDVKNAPLSADEALAGTAIGRYGLDKQFHGDLDATSKGEMLGAGNPATGTAGYVAIEQVTGTLHGRAGSFALQHFGTMEDNKFELTVKVVPGSGTGDLTGICGTMAIAIVSGKHSYKFDYTLPAAAK